MPGLPLQDPGKEDGNERARQRNENLGACFLGPVVRAKPRPPEIRHEEPALEERGVGQVVDQRVEGAILMRILTEEGDNLGVESLDHVRPSSAQSFGIRYGPSLGEWFAGAVSIRWQYGGN